MRSRILLFAIASFLLTPFINVNAQDVNADDTVIGKAIEKVHDNYVALEGLFDE